MGDQIRADWYLILVLVAGFAAQAALLAELRRRARLHAAAAVGGTGTGASAVGMVACCAHHVADPAPFLGLSAATFPTDSRLPITGAAITVNAAGITVAARRLRRAARPGAPEERHAPRREPQAILVSAGIALLAMLVGVAVVVRSGDCPEASGVLPAQQATMGGVEITVTPERVDAGGAAFRIAFDTHSGWLDVDPADGSTLTVDDTPWPAAGAGQHDIRQVTAVAARPVPDLDGPTARRPPRVGRD